MNGLKNLLSLVISEAQTLSIPKKKRKGEKGRDKKNAKVLISIHPVINMLILSRIFLVNTPLFIYYLEIQIYFLSSHLCYQPEVEQVVKKNKQKLHNPKCDYNF